MIWYSLTIFFSIIYIIFGVWFFKSGRYKQKPNLNSYLKDIIEKFNSYLKDNIEMFK